MDNVAQYLQMIDLTGNGPAMQDISSQRNLYQQNLNAMNNLSQQALGKQASPLQSLANALRAQKKPGLGEMLDSNGKIIADPTYGNINASSVMQNPTFNPYENPV